jgi:iron complex transport system permease protein
MANDKSLTSSKLTLYLVSLFFLSIATALISLKIGSVSFTFGEIIEAVFTKSESAILNQIVFELRLPRIILAFAVGGGLSIAGAVFQSILMNPLAEPFILGVSSGGTFGALLSISLGLAFIGQQFFAFLGALFVIITVFAIGKRRGVIDPTTMLLSGVMIGAFFSALIMLLMTFIDSSFRTALFWLLGNLSLADTNHVYTIFPITLLTALILTMLSNKLNILSLGDDTAQHLGIASSRLRITTYLLTSLLVGMIVSVSGIIGFVGLLIPHLCRILFGFDNRIIIPASFFIGAIFMMLADNLARIIISPAELPVGVITAFLGAPLFIYLLKSKKGSKYWN